MTRFDDWEQRLADFFAENHTRPFEWGAWDCILMATAAVAAITGDDRGAAYRGKYSDRAGAANALRELGEGTLLRTVDSQFARKRIAFAQRGDLVWIDGSVGVCMGGAGLFVGEEGGVAGLVSMPRAMWSKAWSVG